MRFDLLIPVETEAVLLVEQEAADPILLHNQLHEMTADISQTKRLAFAVRQAFEREERELFWRLTDSVRILRCIGGRSPPGRCRWPTTWPCRRKCCPIS